MHAIVRIACDPVARYCGLTDSGQKYHIGALGVHCQCAAVRSLANLCRWGLSRVAAAWPGPNADRANVLSGEDSTNDDPVELRAGPPAYPDPLALVDVWKGVGLATLIYIAGIVSIPQEYLEAARVDGAGPFSGFRHILLPLVRPATGTVIILSLIGGLRSFDLIWAMTRGGPYNSTQLLSTYMYQVGFTQVNLGYGSAIAVVIFLLAIAFIITYLVRATREE